MNEGNWYSRFAKTAARFCGRPRVFTLAVAVILAWAITGPIFGFSDTWQLVINTGTTIVTFLMVFLIQNAQNRDASAIQAKLDELIRAGGRARNEFIGIEHLSEPELIGLRRVLESIAGAEGAHHKAIERLIARR
jgi:low affinity Fe/Cu permease